MPDSQGRFRGISVPRIPYSVPESDDQRAEAYRTWRERRGYTDKPYSVPPKRKH